jgi:hypothetical protein
MVSILMPAKRKVSAAIQETIEWVVTSRTNLACHSNACNQSLRRKNGQVVPRCEALFLMFKYTSSDGFNQEKL